MIFLHLITNFLFPLLTSLGRVACNEQSDGEGGLRPPAADSPARSPQCHVDRPRLRLHRAVLSVRTDTAR